MGLLPEINGDGSIEEKKEPNLYTPPVKKYSPTWPAEDKPDKRYTAAGAPTMDNLHECVPDNDCLCITCGRFMPI